MRRISVVVGLLAISWSLAGCDDSGGGTPPTPDEAKQALDVVKKANRGPMFKDKAPAAEEAKK